MSRVGKDLDKLYADLSNGGMTQEVVDNADLLMGTVEAAKRLLALRFEKIELLLKQHTQFTN